MKKYDVVFFDLDGTIVDSGEGVTNSVAYALERFHIRVEDRSELYRFIGPPLVQSFMEFYHLTREQALEAVGYYREYYAPRGVLENRVYDGIPQVLTELNRMGKVVMVATSKPEGFARQILEHEGLAEQFSCIAGASMDTSRVTKEDVIAHALKQTGITDPSAVLMVGDRKFDVLGAKQFGMDCAGVLFGYGSREELEQAGAKYLVNTPMEILKLVGEDSSLCGTEG